MGNSVLNFFLPIDNAFTVQEFKCVEDLGRVEFDAFLREFRLQNMKHQVAAIQKFHKKKQIFLNMKLYST